MVESATGFLIRDQGRLRTPTKIKPRDFYRGHHSMPFGKSCFLGVQKRTLPFLTLLYVKLRFNKRPLLGFFLKF